MLAGKAKEAQARSCHQEVVRQSKAALGSSNNNGSSTISSNGSQEEPAAEVKPASLSGDAAIAANGYLAAAEAALQLRLPALGSHLLELATGMAALVCICAGASCIACRRGVLLAQMYWTCHKDWCFRTNAAACALRNMVCPRLCPSDRLPTSQLQCSVGKKAALVAGQKLL